MKLALTNIAKKENLKISKDQLTNIIFCSDGDLRKGINLLQNINLSDNYSSLGLQLSSIKELIKYIQNHSLVESHTEILRIRQIENFSISDFLNKISKYILDNYIDNPKIIKCMQQLAQIEKNVLIGSLEKIHITAIVATLQAFFI
jgi:DNA polymerase III delta prime subunit